MIRKLSSAVLTLLCLAGLGVAAAGLGLGPATAGPAPRASAASLQSVIPHHGSYSGVDHHGRMVTFSFNGGVTHFAVGHLVIGSAHVSQGMWHETCHNGVCFKGGWVTDGHAAGSWRYGGSSEWTTWTASSAPAVRPYAGTYLGRDHTGLRVHLSFSGGYLRGFNLDHNLVGDAHVSSGGSFDVCHQRVCFRGHWESDYYVVGTWRYANGTDWRPWEAYAYAA